MSGVYESLLESLEEAIEIKKERGLTENQKTTYNKGEFTEEDTEHDQ